MFPPWSTKRHNILLRCVPSINNNLKGWLFRWIWWKFASACPGSEDMRWKFLRPDPIRWPQNYTNVDKEETASNKNEMSLLFYNYSSRKVLSRNVARFAKGFLQRNRVFQSPPLDQDFTTSRGKLPHKHKELQAN
jgi:hypothetical protein